MPNESTTWLYGQLKSKGYNVGANQEEFDNLLRTNAESRKWAYETATRNGLNVGKNLDEFTRLVAPSSASSAHEAPQTLPQVAQSPQQPQPMAPKVEARMNEPAKSDHATEDPSDTNKWPKGAKARALAEAGDLRKSVHDSMVAIGEGMKNLERKYERTFTPEGRKRAQDNEMIARMKGLQTRLPGFTSQAPAAKVPTTEKPDDEGGVHPITSPEVYDTVIDENGKEKVRWMLPDGSLTTSLLEADQAEYGARKGRLRHQFENRMKSNGLNPANPDDVELQAQYDAQAPAFDVVADLWNEAEELHKKDRDRNADREWDIYNALGGGRKLRVVTASENRHADNISHLTRFDLQKMMDKAWERVGPQIYANCYSRLKQQYPGASAQDLHKTATEMARSLSDNAVYQYAVDKNTPKSTMEFFGRTVADMNLINSLGKALARSQAGTSGDMAAYDAATAESAKHHRIAQIGGTVVGMAIDPVTWISGGVGSLAGKGAMWTGGRIMARFTGASGQVATRYLGTTLSGRLLGGLAGGAANLGTYEALKEGERQLKYGGYINPETGQNEGYSAEAIWKQAKHGAGMGVLIGWVGPVAGNVFDPMVKSATSTGGKIALRGGEQASSALFEGTIFAAPDYISMRSMSDDDFDKQYAREYGYASLTDPVAKAKARSAARSSVGWDIWNDSMAMMLGFKAQHGIKSAWRTVRDMAPYDAETLGRPLTIREIAHNRQSFQEKLRTALDKSPADIAMTKEELEELRNAGYGKLAGLFRKSDNSVKEVGPDGKERVVGESEQVEIQYGADGETVEGVKKSDFDGYDNMARLIQDSNVSEAARAKAYFILTGRRLPESTIMGYRTVEDEKGNFYVQSMSSQGSVVTSRRYSSREKAQQEITNLQRQIELNSIEIGERFKANEVLSNATQAACEDVAAAHGEGWTAEGVRKAYDQAVKDLGDPEKAQSVGKGSKDLVKEVEAAADKHVDDFKDGTPDVIRERTNNIYGVNLDEVVRKERDKRSDKEQAALEAYLKALYPEEARQGQAPDSEVHEKPAPSQGQTTVQEAREAGYNMTDQGQREQAMRNIRYQEKRMKEMFGRTDTDAMFEEELGTSDPVEILDLLDQSRYDATERAAIVDFLKAKEARDAAIQRINDNARDAIERQNEFLQKAAHEDGQVRSATLNDGRKVYIKHGNVVLTEDGAMINTAVSDKVVNIYDPTSDEVKQISPTLIKSLDTPTSVEETRAEMEREIIRKSDAEMRAMQGKIDTFNPGETFVIQLSDEEGVGPETIHIIGTSNDGRVIFESESQEGQFEVEPHYLSTLIDRYKQDTYNADMKAQAEATHSQDEHAVATQGSETPGQRPGNPAPETTATGQTPSDAVSIEYDQGDSFRVPFADREGTQQAAVVIRNGDTVTIWTPFPVSDKSDKASTLSGYTTDFARADLDGIIARDEQGSPLDYVAANPEPEPALTSTEETKTVENASKNTNNAEGTIPTAKFGEDRMTETLQSTGAITNGIPQDGAFLFDFNHKKNPIYSKIFAITSVDPESGWTKVKFRRESQHPNDPIFITEGFSGIHIGVDDIHYEDANDHAEWIEAFGDKKITAIKVYITPEGNVMVETKDHENLWLERNPFTGEKVDVPEWVLLEEEYGTVEGRRIYNERVKERQAAEKAAATSTDGTEAVENTSQNTNNTEGSVPTESVEQTTEAAAPEAMPMRKVTVKEKGEIVEYDEPDYLATTPQRTHAYIFKEAGLKRSEANEFLNNMILEAKEGVKDHNGKMPRIKNSIPRYQAEKAIWEKEHAELQHAVDFWEAVRAEQSKALEAEKAELAAQQAKAHDEAVARFEEEQKVEAAKKAEEQQRGAHLREDLVKKYQDSPKAYGFETEVVLPDGTRLPARYVLHIPGATTTSHDPENNFKPTDGFPVDENGNNSNDRDYEHDKFAQDNTFNMANNFGPQALENLPTINPDGGVVDGTNRTNSGNIAAKQNTDGSYMDSLNKRYGNFGFSKEEYESISKAAGGHPRISKELITPLPYTAKTFAAFNATEKKKQSKPETAVKLGKIVPDNVFTNIVNEINSYERLSDYYSNESAAAQALGQLVSAGVINTNDLPDLRTGTALSSQGKEMLENVILGKVFQANPDAVRKLIEIPTMKQIVVMALAEIANNSRIKGDYNLVGEISKAIDLCYRAKKDKTLGEVFKPGVPVSPFGRQSGLFDDQFGDSRVTDATTLLLADLLNDSKPSRLRNVLTIYNQQSGQAAAGQLDLFKGKIKSKEDILTEINSSFINATPKEQQAIVDAAIAERRAAAEAAATSTEGPGEGSQGPEQTPNTVSSSEGNGGGETGPAGTSGDGRRGLEPEYKLSDEVDENGRPFVLTSSGEIEFGRIEKETGLTEAPILLSEGLITNQKTGDGYGLVHIEARHGEQIRQAGYSSVVEFIEDVAKNYEVIRKGKTRDGHDTYMLLLQGKHNNTLMVELSGDGSYWNINTAGIFKTTYGKNRTEVYARHTTDKKSAETSEASQEGSQSGTQPSSRMNATTASSDKDNTLSENKQASAPESSEPDNQLGAGNLPDKEHLAAMSYDDVAQMAADYDQAIEERFDAMIEPLETEKSIIESKQRRTPQDGKRLKAIDKEISDLERQQEEERLEVGKYFNEELSRRWKNGEHSMTREELEQELFMDEAKALEDETAQKIAKAEAEVNTDPTEAQKEAGNYKMGHVKVDGLDITIENPKGSKRSGSSPDGTHWENTMHNTYGYIRGTEGKDGDKLDVFLSDNPNEGDIYVVDQYNPDGTFDEHKVMYGFNSATEAESAFLSNYSKDWAEGRKIVVTGVTREEFKKWLDASDRKKKPFAHYKGLKVTCPVCGKEGIPNYHGEDVVCPQCNTDLSVFREIDKLTPEESQELGAKMDQMAKEMGVELSSTDKAQAEPTEAPEGYDLDVYETKKGKKFHRVKFPHADKEVWKERLNIAKEQFGGTSVRGGYGFKDAETAKAFAEAILHPVSAEGLKERTDAMVHSVPEPREGNSIQDKLDELWSLEDNIREFGDFTDAELKADGAPWSYDELQKQRDDAARLRKELEQEAPEALAEQDRQVQKSIEEEEAYRKAHPEEYEPNPEPAKQEAQPDKPKKKATRKKKAAPKQKPEPEPEPEAEKKARSRWFNEEDQDEAADLIRKMKARLRGGNLYSGIPIVSTLNSWSWVVVWATLS